MRNPATYLSMTTECDGDHGCHGEYERRIEYLREELAEAKREFRHLKAETIRLHGEVEDLRARLEDPQGSPKECVG